MQLRVARLCLDCEELYVGSSCPVCASERYAFLSTWLPSEERRRWRRPASRPGRAVRRVSALRLFFSRWFGSSEPGSTERVLRTRQSDHVPDLTFEAPGKEARNPPAQTREPVNLSPPQA